MATNYNGMPSDIQAKLKKKKVETPVPVPISNSTTLNTPQAVQNAMAASIAPVLPSATSLNTPIAVQNQMAAAAQPVPISNATTLNTPQAVQDQIAAATNPSVSPLPGFGPGENAPSVPTTPITAAGMGMPTDIQNKIQTNGITAAANEAAKIAQDASIAKGAITALGVAQNANVVKNASTGNGTSTPSGTSASGSSSAPTSGTSSSAMIPTLPSGQTASTATGAGETPVKEQNTYFDDVINSKFDYNPATDTGYLQACAQAENAIIQSIIGRGGLYSSVAQSAVAVKLADLSIEYEKMAYDKYVDERTFKMTLATFEQDRIDTAWSQNFEMTKFEADQEQNKFNNQMSLAEFQFAQEKEAFNQKMTLAAEARANASAYASKQSASAKATQASQQNKLATLLYNNKLKMSKLTEMTTRWAQAGGEADAQVADYFSAYGVQEGSQQSDFEDVTQQLENKITDEAYSLANMATQMGEGEMASSYVDTYLQPAPVVAQGSDEANSNSVMRTSYYATYNDVIDGDIGIAQLTKDNPNNSKWGANYWIGQMGEYYYNQLLANATSAKQTAASK